MILIVGGMMAAASPAVQQKQAGWSVYENDRFGTRIAYPVGLFRDAQDSTNGDGITLTATDGARLLVFGANNVDNASPRAYLGQMAAAESGRVTYRTSGAGFAVMSGSAGERIFYQRYIFDDRAGVVHSYRLEYPRRLQGRYGPIIPRLSSSLSWRPARRGR